MKRVLILLLFLLPAGLTWLSCGGYSAPGGQQTSGLKYRAFITNNVSAGTASAGVYILDAQNDLLGHASPISAGANPGMMVVTPNRSQTLVFSGDGTQFADNQFSILNNANESNAGQVTLPGGTESFVVSPDSSSTYIAVPKAPVIGQTPGVVEVINLSAGFKTAELSCPPGNPNPPVCVAMPAVPPIVPVPAGFNPPYRYLSMGNTGNRVLAFSVGSDDVANVVAVITPSNVGTANPIVTFVPGFDHPVAAFFNSNDTIAYVLNCGAECGGQQASIQQLNLSTNTLGANLPVCTSDPVPQCAGSVALVNGSTVYVAGTPYSGGVPSLSCPAGTTLAQTCGMLSIVDLNAMAVTSSGIVITDGYHNRIAMGANGQLFIGARTCTEIIPPIPPPPGAEVRGCLSIYNSQTGAVVIPPANGDATGIQPIATRTVVYVVQGGSLSIYDTATDTLALNPNNPDNPGQIFGLVGQFIDIKTIDF